jgi:hypothetical protein
MLKRSLQVILVGLAAVIAVLFFGRYPAEYAVVLAQFQVVLVLLLAVGSLLLVRNVPGAPTILCLVGSVGYLIFWLLEALPHEYTWSHTPQELQPGCVFRHWSLCFLHRTSSIATWCFPIGFLWFAIRVARQHLTNR